MLSVVLFTLQWLKDLAKSRDLLSQRLVALGDFNIRPAEEEKLMTVALRGGSGQAGSLCFRDAEYTGMSWDPRQNRFFKDQDYTGAGFRFDRIFMSGCLHGASFLVGQKRMYGGAGYTFCLSDHYAVRAWSLEGLGRGRGIFVLEGWRPESCGCFGSERLLRAREA